MIDLGRDSYVLKGRRVLVSQRVTRSIRALYPLRPQVLAYMVPVFLASIAVQTWFRPGTVIANGDIGPPFAQGTSYLSSWNQVADGVGAPSYDIVTLPFTEFLRVARAMGLDAPMSQRVWLTLLVAASSAAAVFFARSLDLSPLAAGATGIFATFNIFRVIVSFDPVPMTALILCGLLGGLVLRAGLRTDPRSGLFAFALISSLSGFIFVNPPHFILLGAWIGVSALLAWARGGYKSFRSSISFLVRVSPLVLLANCWWIIPAMLTILNPSFSKRFAAPGPFAWAWTDRRASLVNALTLNTTWGWNEAMYYPYAARLDRLPFAPLRYAFPILAFFGVVFSKRKERRLAFLLVAIGLAAVLVVKGLHPPLVEFNRWLYVHVPGSWLFREPSKVLLLLLLVYAVLAGIGVANLAATTGPLRIPAAAAVAVVSVAAVAYAYPLFMGDVIPDKRPLLPPAHVRVPTAWDEAARYINALPDEGKMLVLPNADFYGLPTTWGYYGVPFTRWAIQRPILEPLPGTGFNLPEGAQQLTTSIQKDLLAGQGDEALVAFRALGVKYVLLRRDLDRSFPGRRLADPDRLARGLITLPDMHLLRSFRLLDIYGLEDGDGSEVFSATPAAAAGQPSLLPQVLPLLPQNTSLITPESFPPPRSPSDVWSRGGKLQILRIGQEALWKVEAAETSAGLSVMVSDPITATIGKRRIDVLPAQHFHLPFIRPPALITLNDATLVFRRGERDTTFATLPKETELGVWVLRNTLPIDLGSIGPAGDCNDYDARTPKQVGLSARTIPRNGIPILRLSARDHTACVSFPVKPFAPSARYRLQFDYRGVTGSTPRVCLWQEVAERCTGLPALDDSPGWHSFDATTTLSPKTKALQLFFYALGTGDSVTTTEYRQPRIEVFDEDFTRPLELDPEARVGLGKLPPGWLRLRTKSPFPNPRPIEVSSHGPVGDCNDYDDRSSGALELSASTVNVDGTRVLRLGARDHAACVAFPIKPFDPEARYRLRFEYRGVSGSPPRVCLWQALPVARCAVLPELDPSPGWHHLDAPVTLSSKTEAMQLFFYAFGTGDSVTTTEYRDIGVTVDGAESFFLTQKPRRTSLPIVEYDKLGPAEFDVRVSRATGPYLLVLTESFAHGWQLQINGQEATLPHVVVDGYANGWLIDRRGSYQVRLAYQPERFSRFGRWISLVTLSAFAVVGLATRFRNRKKRRVVTPNSLASSTNR
jgi:arabinofuranan 3-O-arabinosyltransferase